MYWNNSFTKVSEIHIDTRATKLTDEVSELSIVFTHKSFFVVFLNQPKVDCCVFIFSKPTFTHLQATNKVMNNIKKQLLATTGVVLTTGAALLFGSGIQPTNAAQIGSDAFSSKAVTTDFNSGFAPTNYSFEAPYVINGNTYTSDNNSLRYDPAFGSLIGQSGGGISNNYELGFIDIVLGTAAQKVGGYLGGGSVDVKAEFFDEFNNLLGTILGAASNGGSLFTGWEAESGLIKRVRFTDSTSNFSVLILDNFTTEVPEVEVPTEPSKSVPEPASVLSLLAFGAVAASSRLKRQQQQKA